MGYNANLRYDIHEGPHGLWGIDFVNGDNAEFRMHPRDGDSPITKPFVLYWSDDRVDNDVVLFVEDATGENVASAWFLGEDKDRQKAGEFLLNLCNARFF